MEIPSQVEAQIIKSKISDRSLARHTSDLLGTLSHHRSRFRFLHGHPLPRRQENTRTLGQEITGGNCFKWVALHPLNYLRSHVYEPHL